MEYILIIIFSKKKGFETQKCYKCFSLQRAQTRISQVRFGIIGVFIEPLGVMAVF